MILLSILKAIQLNPLLSNLCFIYGIVFVEWSFISIVLAISDIIGCVNFGLFYVFLLFLILLYKNCYMSV